MDVVNLYFGECFGFFEFGSGSIVCFGCCIGVFLIDYVVVMIIVIGFFGFN